ncbi:tetratricopeptide repeat protein [Nostoc sp. TCL26-01]|uniref:tetratricopeptide repeat protein n=1 Tax=Nostoc sp. TCL26-01 TaxID=2576904 RepID=UPI0015B9F18F|nr:tetratricopeptide repeat protein [Nostoc sp. TCL26-01]QLE55892.1 tetratricopeptide repeat protein [Nostoc sp. TCL26-01]
MAEEPNSDQANKISIQATAHEQSKVTQIGEIRANTVVIGADQLELLAKLERSTKMTSPGVLKVGNPSKNLAYWQGREAEIAQLKQWLGDENITLIGIEGIGGTGKSMLAAKIYEEIDGFPKRFWADVGSGAIFSDFASQILREFAYPVPKQETQLVEALVKCLRAEQYLLVIDHLESLLQPDRRWGNPFYRDFFQAWVEYGSNSTVLVTTRERPELLGGFEWLSLKGLTVEAGAKLLAEFSIQGDLLGFAQLVNGHPLLLKLVADLLKEEYPQNPHLKQLTELGLSNLQQLLTDPKVVGQHRRRNMGMMLVLDASFERLSNWQRLLLLNISVYRTAFDSMAAMVMLPGYSEAEVEGELRNLVKRSLLQEKFAGKRYFEFHPVILEYVRNKAGEQPQAHEQAIAYYTSKAKQPPWRVMDDVKEYWEIFYHYCQLKNYDRAFDIIWQCHSFLLSQGSYTVQVEVYKQLLITWEKANQGKNWKYLSLLTALGTAYYWLGQYQRAIQFHQKSLEIARKIGDRHAEAVALGNLGITYNLLGQHQQVIEFNLQSLDIAREMSDRQREAISLGGLGTAYYWLGEYQKAIEFREQRLKIAREIGDRQEEAISLGGLGAAYNSLGEYQLAIEFHKQQLQIAQEIGDRQGEAISLNGLGVAYNSLGKYQIALELHGQQLNIAKKIGDRRGEAISLGGLGAAYHSLGQYQLAIEFHQQQLQIAQEIGDRHESAKAWFDWGLTLEKMNDQSAAMGAYGNARELYQAIPVIAKVADCNKALERLAQQTNPVGFVQRFSRWLRDWWQAIKTWLRR